MIEFRKNEKIIELKNGSIMYSVYINDAGYLETVYFGKQINIRDYDRIRHDYNKSITFWNVADDKEDTFSDGFKFDCAPLELSTHALSDKRRSAIVVQKQNGSYETDFLYVSHKIIDGIPCYEGMPHAHGDDAETVEFLLKDKTSDLYVELYLTIFDDKDVIVKNYVIVNEGDTVNLLRAYSMQLGLTSMDYSLVHFYGRWGRERAYSENVLHDGTQTVSTNLGRSSHVENPFVYLKAKNADLRHGEVIGFNLIYSGNFAFNVDCGEFSNANVSYGINEEDFCWRLSKGESFVTPQAVISYSCEGVDKMSQNFHAFIKDNLITYAKDREYKPVLFNSWEGCYFNFDTDSIISYIDDSIKIGTELFVLDDGWFGARNDDYKALGDWYVNKEKIDLRKVIDHCKNKGVKFGIWFEPEMINPDSDLARNHPEYALKACDPDFISLMRHQRHLDFSNPEVVDNIYSQMKAFLDEYPVDYVKWDYNRTVGEHYSEIHGNRQGEIYHRLVTGYYDLIERIRKDFPDVMIEGCASGGGRFDMGTLYYTPQIWTSDESNPARRMIINYNTSIGYPLSTIATHVNDSKIASYKEKSVLALFGTYGYEMNPNLLTEKEKEEINEIACVYKKYHKEVIANGVLYHLVSPNESNVTSMQSVSKDKSNSLVLFTTRLAEQEKFRFLKLCGLDENALYKNSFNGEVNTGAYYENVGINLSSEWFNEFSFRLIIIEKV